ncbi:MAG: hypothetical protein ACHREM_10280 [Polyangiales bacterium]
MAASTPLHRRPRTLVAVSLAVATSACGASSTTAQPDVDALVDAPATETALFDAPASEADASADSAIVDSTIIDTSTDGTLDALDASADAPPDTPSDTPGTLSPSSVDLIGRDRTSGLLDEKMAAFYTLFAQFAPDRLPLAYQADRPSSSAPSVAAMRVARAHHDEYTPAQAAAIDAMLEEPHLPGWMDIPSDFPVHSFGAGATVGCRTQFKGLGTGGATPPSHFLGSPAIDTAHFRIRGIVQDPAFPSVAAAIADRLQKALDATVPDVGGSPVVPFRDYLDHTYDYFKDTLKMGDPSGLAAPAADGGKIPIDVALCDSGDNDAYAEPNDGFIFASLQLAFEDADLRRVTLPHEIFHVFEAAYVVSSVSNDNAWPYEASAVAIEDLVAPGVRRWSGAFDKTPLLPSGFADAMDRSFKCPEEPVHSIHTGTCLNRAGPTQGYAGDYSRFVLLKFLMRNHGLALTTFWSNYEAYDGNPGSALSTQQLGEFQVAALGDPTSLFFDDGDRAAFFVASRPKDSMDLATDEPERYTFRLDPSVAEASVSDRFGPSQTLSLSATLKTLDSSASPVPPGGTHRLLLEIPSSVAARVVAGSSADALSLHFEITGCDRCILNVVALDDAGGVPARTLAPSTTCGATSSLVGALKSVDCTIAAGAPVPRYLAVLLSNFGTSPAAYQVGVTLPQACLEQCVDHYATALGTTSCGGADLATRLLGGYCAFACEGAPQSLDVPYCTTADVTCDRRRALCAGGGVTETSLAAFVPIPTWPTIACSDLDCSCATQSVDVSVTVTYDWTNMYTGGVLFEGGSTPIRKELYPDTYGPTSTTSGVARLGADVIVVGSDSNASAPAGQNWRAVYWANDASHVTALGFGNTAGISISNGKAYVGGGFLDSTATTFGAAYWVLGEPVPHSFSTVPGRNLLAIFADGGKVYGAGTCGVPGSPLAPCYWVDDGTTVTEQMLAAPVNGEADAIFSTGADVYVVGVQSRVGSVTTSGYWKNGTFNLLAGLSGYYRVGITVVGTDVFVSGTCSATAPNTAACVFTNGVPKLLAMPVATVSCYTGSGLVVSGGDVYVPGTCGDSSGVPGAYYWKNGVPFALGAGTATGIALGP